MAAWPSEWKTPIPSRHPSFLRVGDGSVTCMASAKKSPAFQFYPAEWLSSLQIAVMRPEHEGAYIRLLCYCWSSGDCAIPDDDEQLAAMSRLNEGWFKGDSTHVRAMFIPHPQMPGFLTSEFLQREAQAAAARRFYIGDAPGTNRSPRPRIPQWEELRAAVFERDGYRCAYCAAICDAPHCDHIEPLSRGGSSEMDNLTTACAECNIRKGARTPDEWRAR